ncbi:MAG: hypothetical protein CMG46_04320 [Candidatus Marinimicrobia bacterium]|nr:hypothetical protein [Candidatus Neomarinimicrobiota bacterium]
MGEIYLKDGKTLTYRNVIMPWQCDQNAHLNTRFYMEFFDSAAAAFLSLLGHSMAEAKATGLGWVDAHHEVNYLSEVCDGQMVTVWTGIRSIGTTSIKYYHEFYIENDEEPSALCEAVMVHFDLEKRIKKELPKNIYSASAPFLSDSKA